MVIYLVEIRLSFQKMGSQKEFHSPDTQMGKRWTHLLWIMQVQLLGRHLYKRLLGLYLTGDI
jgi:hypothetical protein